MKQILLKEYGWQTDGLKSVLVERARVELLRLQVRTLKL